MEDFDAAFDDAYRTLRIEAGDDPSTLPNPYSRPSVPDSSSKQRAATSSSDGGGEGFIVQDAGGTAASGGGFIVEDAEDSGAGGGGFMVDDSASGGFLPEDNERWIQQSDEEESDRGSSSRSAKVARPNTIPLSAIPEALANLGLDSADPSVLSLFADTAYIPSSSSRRRLAPGTKPEKVVGRQEFQQVASVLIDEMRSRAPPTKERSKHGRETDGNDEDKPDAGGVRKRPTRRAAVQSRKKAAKLMDENDDAGGMGGGFIIDDADDSQDDFEASRQRDRNNSALLDTGSDMTDNDDDDEYNVDEAMHAASSRRRRRGGAQPSSSPSLSASASEGETRAAKRIRRTAQPSSTPTHLNPLQRSTALTTFEHLLAHLPASDLSPTHRRIGTDELLHIVRSVGEKIPPKEVQEMIDEAAKLFAPASAHHQQRPSAQAIKGAAAAQGIHTASIGLDEFAGVLVHNRLL